jgi:hypothetical protein
MMTLRITTDQRIGGHAITRVRSFLRGANGLYTTPLWVARHFEIPLADARRLIGALVRAGHLERSSREGAASAESWILTRHGQQLANATAAQPLTRRTADRLMREIVGRMWEANHGTFAFRVRRAFVFGSYLDLTRDRINDVDVAVELSPRFPSRDAQVDYQLARVQDARDGGRAFSNISAEMFWPQLELYHFLRRRSRGLSLLFLEASDERQEVVFGGTHRLIFPVAVTREHPVHRGTGEGVEFCACAVESEQFDKGG